MVLYMSIPEAAIRWKVVPRLLRQQCETNQIAGAVRFGCRWLIPESDYNPTLPEQN